MKKYLFLILLLGLNSPIFAAEIKPFNGENCAYSGEIQNNQPNGLGVWQCNDGRIYTGEFKNGQFHGKGQYIVPQNLIMFLDTFQSRSTQLKGMMLSGNFKNNRADGLHQVFQNGQHLFSIRFENGNVIAVEPK